MIAMLARFPFSRCCASCWKKASFGSTSVGGIIAIGGSKGGSGKTLLASLRAPGLAQRGYRTGVIDADPNAVFSAWHATYTGPGLRCQAEARDVDVVDLAQVWAEELDAVVIDTAGFGNLTAAAAMGCA